MLQVGDRIEMTRAADHEYSITKAGATGTVIAYDSSGSATFGVGVLFDLSTLYQHDNEDTEFWVSEKHLRKIGSTVSDLRGDLLSARERANDLERKLRDLYATMDKDALIDMLLK